MTKITTAPEPTVFEVLANQARTRSPWQLGATAVGGAINAGFFLRHSGTLWLGLAFVAAGVYGVWGLVETEVERRSDATQRGAGMTALLAVVRGLAIGTGAIAVLASAALFMAAAIGGWNH
jgi:hypothetical protein